MLSIIRLYESEQRARDTVRLLVDNGFNEKGILVIAPTFGQESRHVRAAVAAGHLPGSYIRFCIQSLERGRSIVAFTPPWGQGQLAGALMERSGPVDTDRFPAESSGNASPLSDFIGVPTLAREPSTWCGALTRSSYTFSSLLGMGLLSQDPTPLSSMFSLPTISPPKRPWDTSFGFPVLSKNATPLSSLLGIRVLVRDHD